MTGVLSYATECFEVRDQSQVGQVRRRAADLCQNLQFSETESGTAAIIINELGSNLVKHAKEGILLLNAAWNPGGSWLDILSVDSGPGMTSVQRCLEDGFSSAGTAGNGLGAVRRMASVFDFVTQPGSGTVILARVAASTPELLKTGLTAAAINLPQAGEPVSGDAWAVRHDQAGNIVAMVVDGLGHGISAADASREALRIFREQPTMSPVPLLEAAHSALRSTRGAAAAITYINPLEGKVIYAGIGNIAGMIISDDGHSRSMVSLNGIVGHEAKRFSEFRYDWRPGDILVMYSDGLQSQLGLDKYAGALRRDPAVLAALLWRDFSRKRDDATVLLIK